MPRPPGKRWHGMRPSRPIRRRYSTCTWRSSAAIAVVRTGGKPEPAPGTGFSGGFTGAQCVAPGRPAAGGAGHSPLDRFVLFVQDARKMHVSRERDEQMATEATEG